MAIQAVRKPIRHLLTTHDFHRMGEVGIFLKTTVSNL